MLLFARRTGAAAVLKESEYILWQALQGCGDPEPVIAALTEEHASRLGLTADAFSQGLRRFITAMRDAGLQDHPSALDNKPEPTSPGGKPFAPLLVYLHVTDRCNLQCRYCYNAGYREHRRGKGAELSDEQWADVIDQAHALGATNFIISGGEPLLRRSCLALARHARGKSGGSCELLTNGTLVEQYSAAELLDAFTSVTVSIDGHLPHLHEPMRGTGTFERVRRAIERLCAVSPERVSLRPVLHRGNVHELENFARWAHTTHHIRLIQPSVYTPNRLSESAELESLIAPDDYVGILRCTDRLAAEGKIRMESPELTVNRGCGAGSSILSIDSQGEVFGCQAMHCEELTAGNVLDMPLREIGKHSPVLKALRNLEPSQIQVCRSCALASICGGGCRASAFTLYGDLHARNELFCSSYVKQCEHVLWQAARKAMLQTERGTDVGGVPVARIPTRHAP